MSSPDLIRADLDEARRLWARFEGVKLAHDRATSPQVRAVLADEQYLAHLEVPDGYRFGRLAGACRKPHEMPPTDSLALAGWCDEVLAQLRGEP